ncbi:MAG: LCP family protein [Actinomycetes bacterium]
MSHQQPLGHRRTTALGRRPLLLTATLAAALILAASGIGYATATEVTNQVKHTNVFGSVSNRPASAGGENILLVGNDDRSGLTAKERRQLHVGQDDYGSHAEPIMIVHAADDGSIGIVSIPRDSLVQIPTYVSPKGTTVPAHRAKINSAYSIGGAPLTVSTVERNTGVHIDHYAQIDFLGFVNMVDALGGVPVCFKKAVTDEKAGLNLPAGVTVLNGKQALAYVRARYLDGTSDYGRMKRQQTFLGSVFNQAMSPKVLLNPFQLMSFMNGAASSVTTDTGFDRQAIWNLAARFRGLSPSALTFTTVPTTSEQVAGVGDVEVFDQPKAGEIFARLNTGKPVVDQPKATPPAEAVEVAPANISVRVYNGSSITGLGTKAAKAFSAAGFRVVGTAQNSSARSDATVIEYDPAYDKSLKTLQAALPNATTREVEGLGGTFRLIVGPDFTTLTPVVVNTPTPAPSASTAKPRSAADDICPS